MISSWASGRWWHVTASGVRPLLTLTWPRPFTSTPTLPLPNTAQFGPKQSESSTPKVRTKIKSERHNLQTCCIWKGWWLSWPYNEIFFVCICLNGSTCLAELNAKQLRLWESSIWTNSFQQVRSGLLDQLMNVISQISLLTFLWHPFSAFIDVQNDWLYTQPVQWVLLWPKQLKVVFFFLECNVKRGCAIADTAWQSGKYLTIADNGGSEKPPNWLTY